MKGKAQRVVRVCYASSGPQLRVEKDCEQQNW